jgi:hypothetical protein
LGTDKQATLSEMGINSNKTFDKRASEFVIWKIKLNTRKQIVKQIV